MTIHWKAVEQYFTVVLLVNPLTSRVKPWVIQSFLTFNPMDRKCDHSLETAVLYCGAVCFYTVCDFGKFINFGFGTVRSERARFPCLESLVFCEYRDRFQYVFK